jgi:hypothetical protein
MMHLKLAVSLLRLWFENFGLCVFHTLTWNAETVKCWLGKVGSQPVWRPIVSWALNADTAIQSKNHPYRQEAFWQDKGYAMFK